MKQVLLLLFGCIVGQYVLAQFSRDSIVTDFVLYENRQQMDTYLLEKTIKATFASPLDSTTEYQYEDACNTISQFLLASPEIAAGFNQLFAQYPTLQYRTKRALLEAVYAVYPSQFLPTLQQLLPHETHPKLFAMQAVYWFRNNSSPNTGAQIIQLLRQQFTEADSLPLLCALQQFIAPKSAIPLPNFKELSAYLRQLGVPIIYSLQLNNRDYPGLAIIQLADGSFAKEPNGQLSTYPQLARSAANLPYFLTNGNTPQGIYSIQGMGVSHNNIIGPTPNIQLLLPYENDSLFFNTPTDSLANYEQNYLHLLPTSWQTYPPMQEVLTAGLIGRSEIIAHGTTIDPDYFKGRPFYPLTPTMGCLCAKEIWNIFNGKIFQSDQLNLAQTFFTKTNGIGYLLVINLNNEQKAVTAEEVARLIE